VGSVNNKAGQMPGLWSPSLANGQMPIGQLAYLHLPLSRILSVEHSTDF
jgi:hypothetical protein